MSKLSCLIKTVHILAFSGLIRIVFSDVFTAVVKLEYLIKVETRMINALGIYVEDSLDVDDIPESVVTFLLNARAQNEVTLKPHFIENPINAFHFLKRMAFDWREALNHIICEECTETEAAKNLEASISDIQKQNSIAPKAEEKDVIGAAVAIVRLWHTYKLDLKALFRGKIYNETTDPLTPHDIFYICRVLNDLRMYYKEILWLEEFIAEIKDGHYTGKVHLARAYRALAGSYSVYGMPWKAEELLTHYLAIEPDNKSVQRDLNYYKSKIKSIPLDQRTISLQPSETDIDRCHYEALCRGNVNRLVNVTSRLKCFLKPTAIPILFGKEEVLNYDPRVSIFHDVLSESGQIVLKKSVVSRFARSTILGEDASFPVDDMRVSETAWLNDNEHPAVKRFSQRVELLTGLSTKYFETLSHAEEFQVLNYGIGGMYEVHPDWFGHPLHEFNIWKGDPTHMMGSGERLATWLTYLNPVEAGGATVFLELNITIPVVKGAAAFWYNMKRNSDCDPRTIHAGCPVLLGSKWVANKWIRETGNFFTRKCGKFPDSIDRPRP